MAGACVSKRGHGEQGTGNGGWRQFLEKLFPDSRMGGRVVYMVKQAVDGRRRLPVHCLVHSHARSDGQQGTEGGGGTRRGHAAYLVANSSGEGRWCGEWEREYQILY